MLRILHGDALSMLRTLPDESMHCCVTSPPYWGLRDYGTAEWSLRTLHRYIHIGDEHKRAAMERYEAAMQRRKLKVV